MNIYFNSLFKVFAFSFAIILIPSLAISQDLPTVIPPSPTVANLMQFEEIPVDLNTGIPSISLPLYNNSLSNDLNLNLGLSYHPSGINLDNRSGWTGNGWSLTGLGSISRTVMGKPDEHNEGLLGDGNSYANGTIYDYDNFSVDELNSFLWEVGKGRLDNQPDFFQFNFFGISGRFLIIPENGGLKAIEVGTEQNLIIEFVTAVPNNSHGISNFTDYDFVITSFTITDTRGYRYTFDEKEITNSVTRRIPTSEALVPEDNYSYYSSWQLTKVETSNKKILLNIDYQTYNEIYETTKTYTYEEFKHDPYSGISSGGQLIREYISPLGLSESYSEMEILTKKPTKIKLKENDNYIHLLFNTISGHPEYDVNNLGQLTGCKLNKISIKSGNNIQKEIEFNYSNLNRLMLSSVNETSNGISLPYSFSYELGSPLAVGSEAKDFWGYYNGKTFNPLFTSPAILLDDNQRQTDKDKITQGILTSITFPTNGKKEFNFESNTISYVNNNQINYKEIPENRILSSLNISNDIVNPINSSIPLGVIYIEDPQDINVQFEITNLQYANPYHEDDLEFRIELIPVIGNPNGIILPPSNYNLNNFTLYNHSAFSQSADPSRSSIFISLRDKYVYTGSDFQTGISPYISKSISKESSASGYYRLQYNHHGGGIMYGNATVNLEIQKYKYQDLHKQLYVGGVRIKDIKFTDSNQVETITSYDYNEFYTPIDPEQNPSLSLPISSGSTHRNYKILKEQYTKEILVQTDGGGTFGSIPVGGYFYDIIKSSSRPMASSIKGSNVSYRNVTVSKINPLTDLSQNGKTEYTFTTLQDFPLPYAGNVMPYTPVPIKDYQYGNLLKQEVFDSNNRILKSIENNYLINENIVQNFRTLQYNANSCVWYNHHDTYDSYKASMFDYSSQSPSIVYVCTDYNPQTYNIPNTLTHIKDYFFNEQYSIYEGRALLSNTISKEYFYDSSNNASIKETRQDFAYNNDNYQIATQKTFYKVKGIDELLETRYFYPLGLSLNSNSTTNKNKLIAANKINDVLETQSFRNGSKVSETHNIYYDFDSSPDNLMLPKEVKVGKGTSSPEKRVEFLKYDSYGNPTEVKKTNGATIVYLYGFNGSVPVAKITNASFSSVSSALSGTTSFAGNMSASQENSLRNNASLSNAMISFYRYDPLKGVISTVDDKGYSTTYEYDAFSRLKRVKDAQGKILGENTYHYKNQ